VKVHFGGERFVDGLAGERDGQVKDLVELSQNGKTR